MTTPSDYASAGTGGWNYVQLVVQTDAGIATAAYDYAGLSLSQAVEASSTGVVTTSLLRRKRQHHSRQRKRSAGYLRLGRREPADRGAVPDGQSDSYTYNASGQRSNVASSFSVPDGSYPYAGLIQGSDGLFYGTTNEGGVHNAGTVFKYSYTGNVWINTSHLTRQSQSAGKSSSHINPNSGRLQLCRSSNATYFHQNIFDIR